jgi:glycosyltransferase involved in cell wall biosynthesis
MKVLLIVKNNSQNDLSVLQELVLKQDPYANITIYNQEDYRNDVFEIDLISLIEEISPKRVILSGFDEEYILPLSIVSLLLSIDIEGIQVFSENLLKRYAPFKTKVSNTLVVFPGSILPLNMGSHQRAFNLISALNYSEMNADIIITSSVKKLNYNLRSLGYIAPKVFSFKNNKRKLHRLLDYRRYCEKQYLKYIGVSGNVPELFVDRLSNKATYSLQKTLKRLLESGQYKNVIVNYAWMDRCKDLVSKKVVKEINWICDTHDVQYVRNNTANKNKKRFLKLSSLDKFYEKRVLNSYDHILAISDSDEEILKKDFGGKVVKVMSSFDYAYRNLKVKDEKLPINFGFIGGGMEANVLAVEYLLDNWWPAIKNFSPKSKLFLAGSICNQDKINQRICFDDSIVKMGFVDSLNVFYDKIDISLNPVLVQGGLNFKSVEAAAWGKLLFTNTLGTLCLGKSNFCYEVKDTKSMIDYLIKLELDKELLLSKKRESQSNALSYFNAKEVYSSLIEVLK